MKDNLIIELNYHKSRTAREDETAALNCIAKLFAEKILEVTESELGLPKEDEHLNRKTKARNK